MKKIVLLLMVLSILGGCSIGGTKFEDPHFGSFTIPKGMQSVEVQNLAGKKVENNKFFAFEKDKYDMNIIDIQNVGVFIGYENFDDYARNELHEMNSFVIATQKYGPLGYHEPVQREFVSNGMKAFETKVTTDEEITIVQYAIESNTPMSRLVLPEGQVQPKQERCISILVVFDENEHPNLDQEFIETYVAHNENK